MEIFYHSIDISSPYNKTQMRVNSTQRIASRKPKLYYFEDGNYEGYIMHLKYILEPKSSKKLSVRMLIGIIIILLVIIVGLSFLIYYCVIRKIRKQRQRDQELLNRRAQNIE